MSSRFCLGLFCCAELVCAHTFAAQQPAPRVFQLNAATLAGVKAHPDPALTARAIKDADKAMKTAPHSVMDKKPTPPSGDKHDYTSMARYWWPNPDTPNHLPYVRRDGYDNPEFKGITDHDYLSRMTKASLALALGYYLTGDERYAEHAALLLRTWFLAPATAMHPNLNFAQFKSGLDTGNGMGILDARSFPEAIDAVGMLAGSKSWTAADDAGMQRWFADYYTWLTTSAAGKHESNAHNNHGSWFHEQAAPIAVYLGKPDDARHMAERVRDHRIPDQIDAQGMQKYELARTKSFHYSAFNLQALTLFAATVAPLGIDLYQPVTPGGPSILTAIDALLPYDSKHPWPHEQVVPGQEDNLCPALVLAAGHTHDAKYIDAQKRFECKRTAVTMIESFGN
jgi:hypothetical protein